MKYLCTKRAFTLIETFVAVTILTLAVVGPLTLAARGLNTTVFSRDQLTATHLAQEAIEFIRYKRDNNVLSGQPSWLTGLEDCMNKNCDLDAWTGVIRVCPSGVCPVLGYKEDVVPPYAYHAAGDGVRDTSFRRIVTIVDVPNNDDEKLIKATVEWKSGSRDVSIELQDRIFDWVSGLL